MGPQFDDYPSGAGEKERKNSYRSMTKIFIHENILARIDMKEKQHKRIGTHRAK